MTRDELVERMARAIREEMGAYNSNEPSADTLAPAALTELEKHAVVVPAEPTQKMWGEGQDALKAEQRENAWGDAWDLVEGIDERKIYRAMLAARPR